jgi:hypothetical protein
MLWSIGSGIRTFDFFRMYCMTSLILPPPFTFVEQFIADHPGLFNLNFAQAGLILFAIIVLFLLFFALRDILLRTRSFWYQFFCIVIVTLLPIVGFLMYLLIRPARTVKQRELESMILTLVAMDAPAQIEVGERATMLMDDETSEDDEDDDDNNHSKASH